MTAIFFFLDNKASCMYYVCLIAEG
jgi:hypothetical protein